MTAYQTLHDRFTRAGALREAQAILHWDMQTTMPAGAAEARGVQLATLEAAVHSIVSAPDIPELVAHAAEEPGLSPWQLANLNEIRREHAHAAGVDAQLVDELVRAGARCTNLWRVARADNDFASYRPALEHVVALVRDVAQQKADALGLAPYDALIDQYEPGMTCARINAVFAPLRERLPSLLEQVLARQRQRPEPLPLGGPFDSERQKQLGETVMAALGFDFQRGRLDRSPHPFCGGATDDVRITTRYRNDEFVSSLMGIVHETGHALYQQSLPGEWALQPVGRARGMAVHESQSLLYEMQMARSPAFLRYLAPIAARSLGGAGPAWDAENLARQVGRVRRGLIRVDADEVTYPGHVMLRFELEQEILGGHLQVADLPERWRVGMLAHVGVAPSDDRDGCMQDIHWTDGAFGYFPSYTLGALTAAQLYAAVRRALPDLDDRVAHGDFLPLLHWLRTNVHAWASSCTAEEIITRATGAPLSADAFLAHIERRYLA